MSNPNSRYTRVSIGNIDSSDDAKWSADLVCDAYDKADGVGTLAHCQSGHIELKLRAKVPSNLIDRSYDMKSLGIGWS